MRVPLCICAGLVWLGAWNASPSIAQGPVRENWHMFCGGPSHNGRKDTPGFSTSGTLKWKIHNAYCYRSSPAIGPDGTIYTIKTPPVSGNPDRSRALTNIMEHQLLY